LKLEGHGHASWREYAGVGRVYHLFSKPLYAEIGKENLRNRRRHAREFVLARLVLLDFILENQQQDYLETDQKFVVSRLLPVTFRLALAKIKSCRLGEFPLTIVEGQEALRFEFESAGDVQAIKRTNAQFRPVASAEIAAYLEGAVGHANFEPQSGEPVTPQVVEDFVGIGLRNSTTKDLLGHSMEEFRRMKRTKPKTSTSRGPASRGRGVDIGQIQGHKNAAVGIDRQ
jgi:hypothetical protein